MIFYCIFDLILGCDKSIYWVYLVVVYGYYGESLCIDLSVYIGKSVGLKIKKV